MKRFLAAPAALVCAHAWAQTAPVSAGQLLEQQRRLEQQQNAPAQPGAAVLRDGERQAPLGVPGDKTLTVKRFRLEGNTLLSDEMLQAVLRPWLMKPASVASLRQAAAAVEQAYRDAGWLAQVSLPSQDVTEGELRFKITEARAGRVRIAPPVADARTLSPDLAGMAKDIVGSGMPAGGPLNLDAVQRKLRVADELPGAAVVGSLQAGAEPGSTDVLLQIGATPLVRGDVSVDNQATRSTGDERVSANVILDSPLNHGDQLGVSLTKTRGVDYARAEASVPVGIDGWRIGTNASALRYRVLDEFNTTLGPAPRGSSHTVGLTATYPLVRDTQSHWSLNLGVDQKQQRNEDDSAVPTALAVSSNTRARTVSAGISGYAFDSVGRGGQTLASVQVVNGRLNLDGSSAARLAGDSQTESTQGSYSVARWSASRVQALTGTLAFAASANGQFASKNLDSSEKLYLGGAGAVNAYPTGEGGGSAGEMLNLELRQQLGSQWQASAFYDWGQVREFADNSRGDGAGVLTTGNNVSLRGYGATMSWHAANGLRAKLTWAHRAGSNPLATASGNDTDGSLHMNRIWFSAGASF